MGQRQRRNAEALEPQPEPYHSLRTPILLLGWRKESTFLENSLDGLEVTLPSVTRKVFPMLGHDGPEIGFSEIRAIALQAFRRDVHVGKLSFGMMQSRDDRFVGEDAARLTFVPA